MSYEPCVTLASYVMLLNQQSRFTLKIIGQATVERENGSDGDSDYEDTVRGEVTGYFPPAVLRVVKELLFATT